MGVVLIKKVFLHIFSFLGGVLNGLLGVGAGSVILGVMYACGEEQKAHASVFAFVIPLCVVSLLLSPVSIDASSLFIILGCCAGSVVGTLLLKKVSGKILKALFAAVIIYSGVRSLI